MLLDQVFGDIQSNMTVVLGGTSALAIHFNVKQQNYCFASISVKKSQLGLIFCGGLVHCDVHGQVWVPFGIFSPCWLSMAPRASQSHSFPSWLSWIKFLHHRMKTAIDNSKGQAHVVCHTQLDLYRYYFCLIWIQVRGGPRVPILPMEKHCSQSSKTIRLFDTQLCRTIP